MKWWWNRIAALESRADSEHDALGMLGARFEIEIAHLRREISRLEADLREVRSTQNSQLIARQHEGVGIAALLQEQIEPELTEEEKRMQEEQKQFLSFLGRYQGDNDG